MKPWRERIAEARGRGKFTKEDLLAWKSLETCMVGEQREKYGVFFPLEMGIPSEHLKGWLQTKIAKAILFNNFAEAEHLLDLVEDRALTLKREMA